MERVYHVNVIEVGRSCLIGNVDRMLERKVPHREGLKLGIAGTHPALPLSSLMSPNISLASTTT